MNRRTFTHQGALAMAALTVTTPVFAADSSEKIGQLTEAQFKKVNKDAAAKLKALKPASATLSESDARLMAMIAAGGMMQLEASRLAVQKATAHDVRAIAEAEVMEQTGLSAKLAEFATAKQIAAPKDPHKKMAGLLKDLNAKEGAEFDRAYLNESGVRGHQLLRETMMKVQSEAADPDLQALAATTLPLIQTHLQVSQDEMASMS